MIKQIQIFFLLAVAALLVNCVNVDMETTLNADRSGKGKLVYSWDPSKNMDHLSLDENYALIESNPAISVIAKREYDSEGTHYKEIEWTFEDINKVDLEGLRYSFHEDGDTMVLLALFEEEETEAAGETRDAENLSTSVSSPSRAPVTVSENSGSVGSTNILPESEDASSPKEESMEPDGVPTDYEESQQMEEMLEVMIRAAVDGFRVKFQFNLPHPVLDAPGAQVDGRTATWEIPLKDLLSPDDQESYDEFMMIMKVN